MQSTEAHVLYMKSSSCWLVSESLVFEDFLAAFCFLGARLDFLGLLMAFDNGTIKLIHIVVI